MEHKIEKRPECREMDTGRKEDAEITRHAARKPDKSDFRGYRSGLQTR